MRRKHAEEEEKEKEIVVYDIKNVNSGVDTAADYGYGFVAN